MSFPYKETSKSAAIPGGLKGRTETGNGIRRTGMVFHSTRIDLSKESRGIAVHHPHLRLTVSTAWLTATSVSTLHQRELVSVSRQLVVTHEG